MSVSLARVGSIGVQESQMERFPRAAAMWKYLYPRHNIVTTHFSRDIQDRIRNGAHAILLVGEDFPDNPANIVLPLGEHTKILGRQGTWWEGDWASSLSWLHKDGPFSHMPGEPMLDLAYEDSHLHISPNPG